MSICNISMSYMYVIVFKGTVHSSNVWAGSLANGSLIIVL